MPMDAVQVSDPPPAPITSPEVLAFCEAKGITDEVARAVDLAKQCFQSEKWTQRVIHDPESGGEWLIIDVFVHREIPDVLKANDLFTERWMTVTPYEKRQ